MKRQMDFQAESFIRERKRHTRLRRAIALLCAVVMLLTMNSLKMNADTLEHIPGCGLEEHRHTLACYPLVCPLAEAEPQYEIRRAFTGDVRPHVHSEDCYDDSGNLACGYVESLYYHVHNRWCYDDGGNLVCGLSEIQPHVHTEACYQDVPTLICGQDEYPAHHHTQDCYFTVRELACGLEENPGHIHTAECYYDHNELTCGLEESVGHIHTADCYIPVVETTCGMEEGPGHIHTAECFTRELVCGELESEAHQHTDACYADVLTCEIPEGYGAHTHSESCYTVYNILVCGIPEGEGAHTHTRDCVTSYHTLVCGIPEGEGAHTHTDNCYVNYDYLVCGQEETEGHTHTDACYEHTSELICGEQDGSEWVAMMLGQEGVQVHTHTAECFTTFTRTLENGEERTLRFATCGYQEIPTITCQESDWTSYPVLVSEGHAHTDACYDLTAEPICGMVEHEHTDACYQTRPVKAGATPAEGGNGDANSADLADLMEDTGSENDENETDGQSDDPSAETNADGDLDEVENATQVVNDENEAENQEQTEVGNEDSADLDALTDGTAEGGLSDAENGDVIDAETPAEGALIDEPADGEPSDIEAVDADEAADTDAAEGELTDGTADGEPSDIEAADADEAADTDAAEGELTDGTADGEPSNIEAADADEAADTDAAEGEPTDEPTEGETTDEESGEPTEGETTDEESGETTDKESDETADGEPTDKESGETTDEESAEPTDEESGETADGEPSDVEAADGEPTDEESDETADGEPTDEETDETADGEPTDEESGEPAEFTAGERVIEVKDGSVTLTWGPEAEIPGDVRVEVIEIERGTTDYDILYNNAMAALSEKKDTETTTQVMRFFDITLYAGEDTIEPKAAISVTVQVNEAEATDNDADVDAVHMEDVGAQATVVEATTDSDTVSFEAESFSIYGVVVDVPATEAEEPPVSVAVDLSSVDLMAAAEVTDAVSLSIPDLLAGADESAVQVEGELGVDPEALRDAKVSAPEGVQVDGDKLVLSADALESGVVSLEVTTYATEEYETIATTHKVDIELSDYQGRTDVAEGENITVTAMEDNSLPADATVTVTEMGASAQVVDAPAEVGETEGDAQTDEQTDAQASDEEAAPAEAELTADAEAEQDQPGAAEDAAPTVGYVEGSAAYDITITNGNEDVISETGLVKVVLMPENLNIYDEVPSNAVVQHVSYTLIHEHEGETTELPVDVEVDPDGIVTKIIFDAENFSTSTLYYTVDFVYVDEAGESHFWQFPGTGSFKLSEVLEALDIEAEEINAAKLVRIETVDEFGEKDLYLSQDMETKEWFINSDAAFDDTYELTVVADGKTYVIIVTDYVTVALADLNVQDYLGEAANLNWTGTERLWWIAEATVSNTTYRAAQRIDTGAKAQTYSLALNRLAKNGNINEQTNGNCTQCPEATQVSVYLVVSNDDNPPVDGNGVKNDPNIKVLPANGDMYNGYCFTSAIDPVSGKTIYTVSENTPYIVEIQFKNDQSVGENPVNAENYYIYASIMAVDTKNGGTVRVIYHSVYPLESEFENGKATIQVRSFSRGDNAKPAFYYYEPEMLVTIKLVKWVRENSWETTFVNNESGSNMGQITKGTVITDGTVLDGYSFKYITTDEKTTIVAEQPRAYTYTVQALDKDGVDENFDFSGTAGTDWYLLAETTHADGVYYYAEKVPHGGAKYTKTLGTMYRKSGSTTLETVPTNDDTVTFALIRPANGANNWETLSNPDNMNVKALSGSSVANRYTMTVTSDLNASTSTITLKQGPDASITVKAYKNSTTEESIGLSNLENYYIVGELAFRDGLANNDKRCYFVQKLSDGVTASTETGFKSYNNSAYEYQYLTGTRSYEPELVYAAGTDATAVLEQLVKNNTKDLKIFHSGDPVECYRMTADNGELGSPNTIIKLTKLPLLNSTGVVKTALDVTADSIESSHKYYILAEIDRGATKAYAWRAFNAAELSSQAFTSFTTNGSDTVSYCEEDKVNYYIIQADSILSTFTDVLNAPRYAAGQLIAFTRDNAPQNYVPSFEFNPEINTVKATLTEKSAPTGSPYTVVVELLDADQKALAPATGLSGDYKVLAVLTSKDEATKGQIMGWTLIDVAESNLKTSNIVSDVQQGGKWQGTIAADGFKACDATMKPTDQNIGYNADAYDISLRLLHANNWTGVTTYDDICAQSEAAPSGYDFKGVFTSAKPDNTLPTSGVSSAILTSIPTDTSVIRLHTAYTRDYGIRVYVDQAGLDIPVGDYIVRVERENEDSTPQNLSYSYAFAKLSVSATTGGNTPQELVFYQESDGRIWRKSDGGGILYGANEAKSKYTGKEKGIKLQILQLLTNTDKNFGEWIKDCPTDTQFTSAFSKIAEGDSINLYTFFQDEREEVEDVNAKKLHVYDVLRFTKDAGGITKGEIDGYLEQATNFGLYTIKLSKHATDMESNIGAAILTAEMGADYGFSGNNYQVNRVKVTKQYTDEYGRAVKDKPITLKLYPVNRDGSLGTAITPSTENPKTDASGTVQVVFDKLVAGKYKLAEVINGREYFFEGPYNSGEGTAGNFRAQGQDVYIKFSDEYIEIENININYNYFGDIQGVSYWPILRHSRGGVVVTDNQTDYNALVDANGGNAESTLATVKKAGDDPNYPVLDIRNDIENRLTALSKLLADSSNSQTVRVINTTLAKINQSNGLKLKDDGRYVVVNIDMSRAGSVATVNLETQLDGRTLLADFGGAGNEDSSKVLFNFITRDAFGNVKPYTGKINTATQAAGVLLAPGAIVADLGGNFGGTIICREAQHSGSEIHSDSQNKIQNKNTILTNSKKKIDTGDLEIKKSISGATDRQTWFTFRVTLLQNDGITPIHHVTKDADGKDIVNTFAASGLRSGTTVTFNDDGVALVQVRADERVLITGIPAGTKYKVEEVETAESEHYEIDAVVITGAAEGEITANTIANGVIVKDNTAKVEFTNKKKTGGLKVTKYVDSPYDDDKTKKDYPFTITIRLDVDSEEETLKFDEQHVFYRHTDGEDVYYDMTFVMKHNEVVEFKGLPYDTEYEIIETTPDGFTVTSTGNTGVIGSVIPPATFVNTRKTDLKVVKQWTQYGAKVDTWPAGFEIYYNVERIPVVTYEGSSVELTSQTETYVTVDATYNTEKALTASQREYTFTALPKTGTITLAEAAYGVPAGTYNVSYIYVVTENTASVKPTGSSYAYKAQQVTAEDVEGTLTATLINDYTEITVEKAWGTDDGQAPENASVVMKLYRSSTAPQTVEAEPSNQNVQLPLDGSGSGNNGGNAGGNTGDTTGDTTGDDTGDTTGDDTGDTTGDDTGDTTGDDTGDTTGDDTGDTTGDDTGDTTSDTTVDDDDGNDDATLQLKVEAPINYVDWWQANCKAIYEYNDGTWGDKVWDGTHNGGDLNNNNATRSVTITGLKQGKVYILDLWKQNGGGVSPSVQVSDLVISGYQGSGNESRPIFTINNASASITFGFTAGTGNASAISPFQLASNILFPMAYADEGGATTGMIRTESGDVPDVTGMTEIASVILSNEAGWSYSWTGLPTDDGDGHPYYYYLVETEVNGVNAKSMTTTYDSTYTQVGSVAYISKTTITNTPSKPDTGSLIIEKNVQIGGQTPAQVDAALKGLADGTYTFGLYTDEACNTAYLDENDDAVTRQITISGGTSDTATISGLPEDDYWVKEISSDNAKVTLVTGAKKVHVTAGNDDNPVNIPTASFTNQYELTKVKVTKDWQDSDNQDGKRPSSVSVQLKQNGVAYGSAVTLSASNSWTYTWLNLAKKNNGDTISYTVEEVGASDNKITFNGAEYTVMINDDATFTEGTGYTIVNGHTPEETEATVKKVWNDGEDQDGIRPEELKVTLSNGTEVTLNEANNWSATVEHLPKYSNGQLITYTWTEDEEGLPAGYELTDTSVNGKITTLTNSHTPEETEATVIKVWDDGEDQDGIRPESLKVTLSNGESVTLNAGNGWTATVEHLPKYDNGVEIEYTWTEGTLPEGYELTDTSVNGKITTLTNSHTPEETEATVKKVWVDGEDQDGIRPATLVVKLLANGEDTGKTVTLTKDDNWAQKTIDKLPKYANGVEIEYTWTEGTLPDGYELTDTSKDGKITTLTNKHTPEETEASVVKVWNDDDNQGNVRPATLVVKLLADSVDTGKTVMLTEDDSWAQKTIENLPKYADGVEIAYTWTEENVPEGYTLTGNSKEGTITTLTNRYELTDFHFYKLWRVTEQQKQADWYNDKAIKVILTRYVENTQDPSFREVFTVKAVEGEAPVVIATSITGNENYTVTYDGVDSTYYHGFTIQGLEKYNEDGVKWTYQLTEDDADLRGYFTIGYNKSAEGEPVTGHGVVEDGGTIINTPIYYSLPSTGGAGTTAIYIAGASLLILAVLGFIWLNRKRDDGAGI